MNNVDDEAAWEDVMMAMLRDIVDGTALKLGEGNLTDEEVDRLLQAARSKVLLLFPDKESVYDLIYTPRFNRIIQETRRCSQQG